MRGCNKKMCMSACQRMVTMVAASWSGSNSGCKKVSWLRCARFAGKTCGNSTSADASTERASVVYGNVGRIVRCSTQSTIQRVATRSTSGRDASSAATARDRPDATLAELPTSTCVQLSARATTTPRKAERSTFEQWLGLAVLLGISLQYSYGCAHPNPLLISW